MVLADGGMPAQTYLNGSQDGRDIIDWAPLILQYI